MKRLFGILLSVVILSCSCSFAASDGPAPAGESPSPAADESSLPYTSLVPDGLAATRAFRQAVADGAVILVNNQPVTGGELPRRFDTAVRAGGDAQLLICAFDWLSGEESPIYQLTSYRYTLRGGVLTREVGSCQDPDGELRYDLEPQAQVAYFGLNDYGRLSFGDPRYDQPIYFPVINERELDPDFEQADSLRERYLEPLSRNLRDPQSWEGAQQFSGWVYLFQSAAAREGLDLTAYYPDPEDPTVYSWPLSSMLDVLSHYFDGVTREMIVADTEALELGTYDSRLDSIETGSYNGYWGTGVFDEIRVVSWRETGDTLAITYQLFDPDSGAPQGEDFLLTVRTLPDTSFRYLQNQPALSGN